MNILIKKTEFKSSNKRNIVKVNIYQLNQKELYGVVVILHGMKECKEIYETFAEYLASKKYIAITYDHIGHGDSIETEDDRGFFANKNGYNYLIEDLKYVVNKAKKYQLPIFLFGHSMGSLIARNYASKIKTKELAGMILCGTIGQQWAIDGAIQLAEYMIERKGPRYRSRKLNQLITQIPNLKFQNMDYQLEWITRDKDFIRSVMNDKRMNYIYTAAGFKDAFMLTKLAGETKTIENTPKDLPILLASGSDDILGEFGQGVKRLEEAYLKAGIKDVYVQLYQGARHNLIQEINREEVIEDIYNWIEVVRLSYKE